MARRRKNQQEPIVTLLVLLAVAVAAGLTHIAVSGASILTLILLGGILISVVLVGLVFFVEARRRRAFRALDRAKIDSMDGVSFERYVGNILKEQGYQSITYTKTSGDYGVDIIVRRDGLRTAIQVKRSRNPISGSAVQQAVAGMAYYKCSRCMVITNARFTVGARTLAASNDCSLIDGLTLGKWIDSLQS